MKPFPPVYEQHLRASEFLAPVLADALSAPDQDGVVSAIEQLEAAWSSVQKSVRSPVDASLRLYAFEAGSAVVLDRPGALDRRRKLVELSRALRNGAKDGWNAFEAMTGPWSHEQVKLIWRRRMAYLLFCDVHEVWPWRLDTFGTTVLRRLLRFSPGRCRPEKQPDAAGYNPGNQGVPYANLAGADELTTLFYVVDDAFDPGDPTALYAGAQTAAQKPDLPFPTPKFAQSDLMPPGLVPGAPVADFKPPTYVSARIYDHNPGDYFEYLAMLVGEFPDAFSRGPRHYVGRVLDLATCRDYRHVGANPALDFDVYVGSGTWAKKVAFLSDPKGAFFEAGTGEFAAFGAERAETWMQFLKAEFAVGRSCFNGKKASECPSFRAAWVWNDGTCHRQGPALVSMARAGGLCATVNSIFPQRPAYGASSSTYTKPFHVGIAFHGWDLDCCIPHVDYMSYNGARELGIDTVQYLPGIATLTPLSAIEAVRNVFAPLPWESLAVAGEQRRSLLHAPSHPLKTSPVAAPENPEPGLATWIRESWEFAQGPGAQNVRPLSRSAIIRKLNDLLDRLRDPGAGDAPWPMSAESVVVEAALAKVATAIASGVGGPAAAKFLADAVAALLASKSVGGEAAVLGKLQLAEVNDPQLSGTADMLYYLPKVYGPVWKGGQAIHRLTPLLADPNKAKGLLSVKAVAASANASTAFGLGVAAEWLRAYIGAYSIGPGLTGESRLQYYVLAAQLGTSELLLRDVEVFDQPNADKLGPMDPLLPKLLQLAPGAPDEAGKVAYYEDLLQAARLDVDVAFSPLQGKPYTVPGYAGGSVASQLAGWGDVVQQVKTAIGSVWAAANLATPIGTTALLSKLGERIWWLPPPWSA